jgi:RNA polymerase sigma-70 factor (ECF subfamily)
VFKTADGVLRDLHRRRQSRDAGRHVELTEDIPSDTPTPFESTRWKQNLDILRAAILSLPRQERLVLMMHRLFASYIRELASRWIKKLCIDRTEYRRNEHILM